MKNQYTGEKLAQTATIKRTDGPEEKINPYIPEPDLIQAVNLAILLERPLLLMGQPGCGKSKLAQAVAYELYHKEGVQDYKDLYFEWNITSASKAKDGLYEYDAIQRLGDAQIKGRRNLNKRKYIYDRPMGSAIKKSVAADKRAVLLIDEIDKADIDFPNDLLNEIDKSAYVIKETNQTIVTKHKPIIFITSNAEKDLPDAFLRRCLFHHIEPLKQETLEQIIERRFYKKKPTEIQAKLIDDAIRQFIQIRKELKKVLGEKNVSTSELLDWFAALKYYSESDNTDATTKKMVAKLESVGKDIQEIPFQQALLKNLPSLMYFDNIRKKSASTTNG